MDFSKAAEGFGQFVSLLLLVCATWSHGHHCSPLEAQKSNSPHTLKEQHLHSPCGPSFLRSHSEEEVCWIDCRPLRLPQFIPGLQLVLYHTLLRLGLLYVSMHRDMGQGSMGVAQVNHLSSTHIFACPACKCSFIPPDDHLLLLV